MLCDFLHIAGLIQNTSGGGLLCARHFHKLLGSVVVVIWLLPGYWA